MRTTLTITAVGWNFARMSMLHVFLVIFAASFALAHGSRSPELLQRPVTLNCQRMAISTVLNQLARQTGVTFVYSQEAIQADRPVSLTIQRQPLREALVQVLASHQIDYRVSLTKIILTKRADTETRPAIITPVSTETPISGTVMDKNGTKLPGVSVVVKGTRRGTVTDHQGRFELQASSGETLLFSYIGYTTLEKTINGTEPISLVLTESSSQLQEVSVIGSRSAKPRTDVDRPVPVDIIGTKELQATGQVDLGQMVQYTSPSFNSAKTGINGTANFADPATLRGMGPDQVLLLVNGKRRHQFSTINTNVTIGKGTVVSDMNALPSLAIEQIEILRDGAAAQYGSDAIAGIVNLNLKRSIKKGTLLTQYGVNKAGDGQTFLAAVNYGFSLGKANSFLNATLHWQDVQPTDRSEPYIGTIYSSNKDTDNSIRAQRGVWPATGDFRVAKYGSNETHARQVFINAGYPLSKDWSLYGFGGYSNRLITSYGFFRNAIPTNANSVPEVFPDGYTPKFPNEVVDYSGVVGVTRKAGKGWNLDFSAGYGANSLSSRAESMVNPSYGAATPTSFYYGKQMLGQSVAEANLSKNLEGVFGTRSFNLALGAQYRVDHYKTFVGEPLSYELGPLGLSKGKAVAGGLGPQDVTDVTRSNVGLYADVESDITDRLLVDVALRFENYSDFGSNVSGKLASRFKLNDMFAIRGSINKGFRAPSLQQVHASQTVTTIQSGQARQTRLVRNTEPRLRQLGIDPLKAETSWNYSLGLTAKLGNDILLTLDGYQIDISDRIILSENLVVDNIASLKSLFPATQEVYFFTNNINTRTKGIDFVATYRPPGNGINASLAFTFNETAITNAQPAPALLQEGTARKVIVIDTISRALIETSQPRQKILASLGYRFDRFNATLRANYFGPITAWEKPAGGNHRSQTFSAKTTFDLLVAYNFTKGIQLAVGANNFTDVYPDKVFTNYASYFTGQTPYTRTGNQFGFNGAFYYTNLTITF